MGTKANPSKPKGAKLEQEPPCPEGEPLERNKLLKPMFSNVPQLFSFVFLCFHCLSFVFQLFSNGFPMDWVVSLRFSLVFHCLPMLSNAFHCFPFVFSIVFPNGFQWLSFVLQWFSHGFHWFPFGSQWSLHVGAFDAVWPSASSNPALPISQAAADSDHHRGGEVGRSGSGLGPSCGHANPNWDQQSTQNHDRGGGRGKGQWWG